MRTSLKALATVVALVVATLVIAPAAPAEGAPWIQSDQADYPPGATVTLSAGGFAAAEAVHLNVNDDQGRTWTYDADLTADDGGEFTTSFTLPNWFVATYAVTATAASGTATTTFTDGRVTVSVAPSGVSADVTVTKYKDDNPTCSGAGNGTNTSTYSTPQNTGAGGGYARLVAGATDSTGTRNFQKWTVNGTDVAGNGICVNGTGNDVTAVATYSAPTNGAPVAANDSYSTNEDTQLNVAAPGVLGNDSDPDTNPLTAVLVTGPAHGFLELNVNGSFNYTPTANYAGPDSFTYRATDGSLDSNLATVSLTVNAVNDAPVAHDNAYSAVEDTPLTVSAPGVLANDTDLDSGTLTATKVSNPAHGTVTVNANGSFTYTPNANYAGPDSFTYQANDGSLDSNVATVSLTVTAVNDAPVAADDSYSVDEDGTLARSAGAGVLANDTDAEGDSLTAALVVGPIHGTLTLNPDGSFTYAANANFHGSDSFTYRANDGNASSNLATVSLTVNSVNDDPVAHDDKGATDEDTPVVIDVLANDSDPADGDSVSVSSATDGDHGSVVVNLDGTVTYTPVANYNGPDTFTYTVGDGQGGSDTASVSITVNPVNDAPVATDDSYSVDEDGVLAPGAASGALANDTDVDGDSLTVALVDGPTHGTLALNPDGSFTYSPDANFHGSDSFTYRASDGSLDSNVATASLTVDPVNDDPVADDDSAATDEDTAVVVHVLVNDSDPADGDPVSVSSASDGDHGSVVVNLDGTVTYTPAANYNGPDTFTYTVVDGHGGSDMASVSITVHPVNDAPVAADDAYSVDEDLPLTTPAVAGVMINDGDLDGDALTALLVAGPSHGTVTLNADGPFTYTPDADFYGADSFTYQASDGALLSNVATVSIAVNTVNDAPVANGDSASTLEDQAVNGSVAGNDSDVDGDDLTWSLAAGGQASAGTATVESDGSFTYTPQANFYGSDSFTYRVCDNDSTTDAPVTPACDTATVTVDVAPVNDKPVADDETATTDEDTAVGVDVLAGDSDVDGDHLMVTGMTDPAHGSVVDNGDGTVTYTPDADYNGPDSFTYTVCDDAATTPVPDDEACDDGEVLIPVTPVNDAPVVIAGADQSILEGGLASITATVTDVDGDTSFTASVNWGDGSTTSASVTPAGQLSASHVYADDELNGDDIYPVLITVTDHGTSNGLSDPLSGAASLHVTVSNVAPTVAAPTVSVNPATGLVSLLTTFTDPAGSLDSTYSGSFSVNGSSVAGSVSGTSMSGSKTLAPGCYAIDATGSVTDNDGGTGSSATTHTGGVDVYVSSFLSPIRDDTRNLAKWGNVVPIKVSLASQCIPGTTVTNVPLFLTLVQGDATNDDTINDTTTPVVESVSSADSGSAMRVADGKYIYNLTTKQFTVAKDYTIRVRVGSAAGPIILKALITTKK